MPRKPRNLTLSEDDIGLWCDRLKASENRVREMRDETRLYREAFHGEFPTPFGDESEGEQVYVNRTARVVMQWVGAMYAQNPTIRLKPPWHMGDVARKVVAQQEAVSNAEMDRIKLEETMRRALQTSFLDGWAWCKSGFHAQWEYEAEDLQDLTTNAEAENAGFETYEPSLFPTKVLLTEDHEDHLAKHKTQIQKLGQKFQLMQQQYQSGQMQGAPPSPVVENELIQMHATLQALDRHQKMHVQVAKERDTKGANETNVRVLSESIWADTVHNSNMIWDLHATGTHDWRWTAERIIRPYQELRKVFKTDKIDSNFKGAIPGSAGDMDDEITGGGVKSEVLEETRNSGADADDLAYMWKIWDSEHRRVIWFHDEEPVKVEAWPHKYLRSPPTRMLYYELRDDEFWPISPVSRFWAQQLEINRYRTKAGVITRRFSRQAIADPRIPEDLITDIINAKDGAVHKLTAMGVKLQDAVHVIEWGNVPPDVYQLGAMAQNDIEMDSGLGEPGLSGSVKAKTATAAKVGASAAGVTLDVKLAAISRLVGELAQDERNLMRQYYVADRYTKFLWEGVEDVFQWSGGKLEDFEVEVEIGSSRKQDRELLRMQLSQAIQLGSQIQGVDVPKLFQLLLSTYDEIRNPSEFMIDQATMQQPQTLPGMGPGQGQNQQEGPPGREAGPQAAQGAQPAMDPTKAG